MQNGGREPGGGSRDLTFWARLSPEYVFGAPTWSWTLGAVSALCPPLTDSTLQPEPRPAPPNFLPFCGGLNCDMLLYVF